MKAIEKIKTSREPGPNSVQFDENMHFTQVDMLTQEDSEELVAFIKENLDVMLNETCYAHTLTHMFQHDTGQTQKFMFAVSRLRDNEGKPLFDLRVIGDQKALVYVGNIDNVGAGASAPVSESEDEILGDDDMNLGDEVFDDPNLGDEENLIEEPGDKEESGAKVETPNTSAGLTEPGDKMNTDAPLESEGGSKGTEPTDVELDKKDTSGEEELSDADMSGETISSGTDAQASNTEMIEEPGSDVKTKEGDADASGDQVTDAPGNKTEEKPKTAAEKPATEKPAAKPARKK